MNKYNIGDTVRWIGKCDYRPDKGIKEGAYGKVSGLSPITYTDMGLAEGHNAGHKSCVITYQILWCNDSAKFQKADGLSWWTHDEDFVSEAEYYVKMGSGDPVANDEDILAFKAWRKGKGDVRS